MHKKQNITNMINLMMMSVYVAHTGYKTKKLGIPIRRYASITYIPYFIHVLDKLESLPKQNDEMK